MINRLKALYFTRQINESLIFSYLSMFLALYGFSESEVGILIGIVPLVTLVATPILGLADDGQRREKWLLFSCCVLLTFLPLLWLTPELRFWQMALLIVTIAAVRSPVSPAVDSMTTILIDGKEHFSNVRVWASVCYIIFVALGGWILDTFGIDWVIYLSCAANAVVSVMVFYLPAPQTGRPKDSTVRGDLKLLFGNRYYVVLLLSVALLWSPWSASYNYDGVYFNKMFQNAGAFGWTEALRVVFELSAILILIKLKNKTNIKFFLVALGASALLKYAVFFLELPLAVIACTTSIMGATYGAVLYCYVDYIASIVRKYNIHFAMTMFATASALFQWIYTYVGSFLIDAFGMKSLYVFLAAVTVVGIPFGLLAIKTTPNPVLNSPEDQTDNL